MILYMRTSCDLPPIFYDVLVAPLRSLCIFDHVSAFGWLQPSPFIHVRVEPSDDCGFVRVRLLCEPHHKHVVDGSQELEELPLVHLAHAEPRHLEEAEQRGRSLKRRGEAIEEEGQPQPRLVNAVGIIWIVDLHDGGEENDGARDAIEECLARLERTGILIALMSERLIVLGLRCVPRLSVRKVFWNGKNALTLHLRQKNLQELGVHCAELHNDLRERKRKISLCVHVIAGHLAQAAIRDGREDKGARSALIDRGDELIEIDHAFSDLRLGRCDALHADIDTLASVVDVHAVRGHHKRLQRALHLGELARERLRLLARLGRHQLPRV
mmetsp:Transcript_26412/g.86640  ORF Transcript_26412/g.86640 Transcript_26412/m.86640 type:complete len:327 (+) Transcript_26412:34-1014(+)